MKVIVWSVPGTCTTLTTHSILGWVTGKSRLGKALS